MSLYLHLSRTSEPNNKIELRGIGSLPFSIRVPCDFADQISFHRGKAGHNGENIFPAPVPAVRNNLRLFYSLLGSPQR